MTSLAVLIPVKSSKVKSRLAGILSEDDRREFTRLLLSDVLGAFNRAGLIRHCYVVSSDHSILKLAAGLGAHLVEESGDSGVNSAVQKGLEETGFPESVLVVPSDLPLLRTSDIRHALKLRSSGLGVVIAPSKSFNGTNLLMFSGALKFRLSYDKDSFWNHIAAGARQGLSIGVCSGGGLMFDVDSPDDFRALARSRLPRRSVEFARRAFI